MSFVNTISSYEPYLRSLLRIVVGFTFSLHGYQKFFGWFGGLGGHRPPLDSLMGVAGVIETIGGTLIILGLFTRLTAFILCGQMAIAYFRVHLPMSFFPLINGGEITVLYCFTYLWMCSAGAGPWSLDRAFGRKH
ncbi:MAG: DoxX family protein [Bryobacterales bacterium]|nr:DoxX family protein [Bryobacterales bacterium]